MSDAPQAAAGRAHSRRSKALSALGVLAAVVLCVNANVLVARFYERWDVSSEHLYTLSPATLNILRDLHEPVTLTVLLARTDPLLPPLRQLLTSYGAVASNLDVKVVDPEQNPAELLALQQKYGISAGKADDGRVVTDAVILLARGERTWFVTSDELGAADDDGRAKPRLEQALTEGIAGVLGAEKAKLCFATGRGERSLEDVGPDGLAELRRRLEKSNYETDPLDLTRPDAERALEKCRLLVIAAPEQPYGGDASARVVSYVKAGGSALVLASPELGEDSRVRVSGLEPLAELGGMHLERNVVLENDSERRLPRGAGEVFFASPVEHAATRGLVLQGGKAELSVIVSKSRSLTLASGAPARPLLESSPQAFALEDLKALLDGKGPPSDAKPEKRTLMAAAELEKPARSQEKHGPRLVIAGFSTLGTGQSYRDPALVGNRLLFENVLAWAAARPPIVSVPEKPARSVGLALTEESLGEVLRYVLVYMPGAAALIGAFVLLRRRAEERASRRGSRASA
ncbi:MAG TPA: GldG family protein [Polyangiaceae bacterium]|nr:GldG family protein [Polyangiaceae bacterium]